MVASQASWLVLLLLLFILCMNVWMRVFVADEDYYKGLLSSPSSTIKCKDGSFKFSTSQLNDDFCDCPDASDEPGLSLLAFLLLHMFYCIIHISPLIPSLLLLQPISVLLFTTVGTSACPNGKFYCKNAGHIPFSLYSSRVNDGICG